LDVGVETLFKTFLELPEEVTGAKLSYSKRREAVEGNFHQLLRGVKDAAGDRLFGIELTHVQFYHNLRNKLYHQGNGITVPVDKAKEYAAIAVELLHRLLSVDLQQEIDRPHRVVADEFDGGLVCCGICKQVVHIPGGVVFVLAETLEPVCWKCGYRHADELCDAVRWRWRGWDPDDDDPDNPCYVDPEDREYY
jgi:hypothetical protein